MSTFIRRYSRYLNEKAVSYRQVAFDFTKVKRGYDYSFTHSLTHLDCFAYLVPYALNAVILFS